METIENSAGSLGPVGKTLQGKLIGALNPSYLLIIDESHQHHGHSGAHPSGESHFRIKISAASFAGISRVGQHRLVNAAIAEELKSRVHALSIEVV